MNTIKDLYDIITLPPHQLMELSAATWSHVNSDCILIPNIINCAVYSYRLGHTIFALTADRDGPYLYINDLIFGISTMIAPNAVKCNIEETLDDVCAYLIKTTDLHVTFTDVFAFLNGIINMHRPIES